MSLGQIEARKIYGKLNNADLYTNRYAPPHFRLWLTRSSANNRLLSRHLYPLAEKVSHTDMDTSCQPLSKRKRVPGEPDKSTGAKNCRMHHLRYHTPLSSTGTDSSGRRTQTGHNGKQ
jgi:hypothetical protein